MPGRLPRPTPTTWESILSWEPSILRELNLPWELILHENRISKLLGCVKLTPGTRF